MVRAHELARVSSQSPRGAACANAFPSLLVQICQTESNIALGAKSLRPPDFLDQTGPMGFEKSLS